jgi:DNA recombination protein RmuC
MTQTWLVVMTGMLVVILVIQIALLRSRPDPVEIIRTALRDELSTLRQETAAGAAQLRTEMGLKLGSMSSQTLASLDMSRETLGRSVKEMQEGNEKKLEQMRQTVDEKLQGTLERRLTESFRLVQAQLESVQKGLGEMQQLATGVGDLRKVLSNVKTRGIFGEVQLRAILEDILTPDQFCSNYAPSKESRDNVEFAVALPGPGGIGSPVFLPIDSKFPQEDYRRLLDATERADVASIGEARDAMYKQVRTYAKTVCSKYIVVPFTTPFAIVFLPTESLYAEILRQPGLVEELQRDFKIALTGPTTLGAFLTSLRMGFHTMAIEQRANEVWNVLAAVKTEFQKYGDVLAKLHKQLGTAQQTIEAVGTRHRAMDRKLREVQSLTIPDADKVLGLSAMLNGDALDESTLDADTEDLVVEDRV